MPKKPKPTRPRGRPVGWRKPKADRVSAESRISFPATADEKAVFQRIGGAATVRGWLREILEKIKKEGE